MHRHISALKPQIVVVDPISNLTNVGSEDDSQAMLTRLLDFLKVQGITAFMTYLARHQSTDLASEDTDLGISSITDAWLLLRDIEHGGERNRGLYVLKARGMAHSNQIREFRLTENGIQLVDVYTGPEGVLTGSARLAQEARERAADLTRQQDIERKKLQAERRTKALEAQIAALQAELNAEEYEVSDSLRAEELRAQLAAQEREAMTLSRQADVSEDPQVSSVAKTRTDGSDR
jgi:circadian clock protein KaiC